VQFAPSVEEEPMRRSTIAFAMALILLGAAADPAASQDLRPAVFGAAGAGHLFRAEDQSFGTGWNLGLGIGADWRRLGFDAELHRTSGLTPRAVECGVVNVQCVGSARSGFLEATMVTGNVSYFFGRSRVRPYVTGSVGILRTTGVNSLTISNETGATLSEFQQRNTGLAVGVGFGVNVPLTDRLSLRPEFRTYSSVAMSSVNLGLHRAAIGIRYRW
jgi:opacity protein-like surface antigen